jgi:SAM-dependent methyltransferase
MDDYRAASLQGWSSVAPDWAELTDRIDRQLGAAADWIIDAVALEPGERVLELAGGPGTLSMIAAQAVGPSGHVIYSDFAEPMVAAARERLSAAGLTDVECRQIDAEAIDLPDGSVDAVVCRMGFMLMADPAAALRETARVLAPGGRVGLAVWSDAASNPWAALPMQVVMSHFGAPPPPPAPDAPGLFAFGDHARLSQALEASGFESVRIEALDDRVEFESADQWLELTRRLAGPLAALFAGLDPNSRAEIEQRIRDTANPYELADGRVSMPERMVVASAHV